MTEGRIRIAELRHTANAQHYSSADIHGVSVKPSQLLVLLDAVEAARRVTIALDSPHPNIAVIGCRAELDAALAHFGFGETA